MTTLVLLLRGEAPVATPQPNQGEGEDQHHGSPNTDANTNTNPHSPHLNVSEDEAPDPYVSILTSRGFLARRVPILAFEKRREGLAGLVSYATSVLDHAAGEGRASDNPKPEKPRLGVVATSARAAWAISDLGNSREWGVAGAVALSELARAVWWVTGPATAQSARRLGVVDLRGEEAGSADALVSAYASQWTQMGATNAAFVFISGSSRRDAIPDAFAKLGLPLLEFPVYATVPRSPSIEELNHVVLAASKDAAQVAVVVCFFSPSGVQPSVAQWIQSRLQR